MTELRNNNFNLEVAKGNIPKHSLRGITASITATTTESTISENLTGRYPFPAAAAQMTLVSTSANDAAAGTGAQTIFIRGLTEDGSDWVEDTEIIALNGVAGVNTIKFFIRVNSIAVLTAGATGWNEGVITISNGGSTLHSMPIGTNLTNTMIWTNATNIDSYMDFLNFIAAKSVNNVTFRMYITPTAPFTLPTLEVFKFTAFEGQLDIPATVPFKFGGGTDIEFTADATAATIAVSMIMLMTMVEQ